MGRDPPVRICGDKGCVSIHAPAWGATLLNGVKNGCFVFQSTRPHGARLTLLLKFLFNQGFNPRARMGRDGAICGLAGVQSSFNPRARMGRDKEKRKKLAKVLGFNPRARMGRDD